ncbi:CidA/LrgA family protein [Alcanivorax sp. 1008]|uniref:CidA/LrgA family protein n=1 Tax=Alcanivorax sp. 1008 TaxID=2816853 RepID=UPI001D67051B|nr:CidA/LrgA family protein [Alcanivorax sp. 1008]MCC1495858.1 CidA/LrgA family protein [Alcanivorax sp. 1008]
MLDGLLILLAFQFAGDLLVRTLGLPLPGPVLGMVLLLIALTTRAAVLQRVAPAANLLIGNLTLLFFPIGIGIVLEWERYSKHGLALLVSIVAGTIIALVLVTALLKLLLRSQP